MTQNLRRLARLGVVSPWLALAVALVMVAAAVAVSLLIWAHDQSLIATNELALASLRHIAALHLPEDVWSAQAAPMLERVANASSPLPWVVLVGGVAVAIGTGALIRALQASRHEIGARQQVENELRLASAQLQGLFDHSPIHIVLKDLEGRYVMVNREWARFYGEDAAATIGKSPEEVHGPEAARPVREQEAAILRGGEFPPHEIQVAVGGAERSVLIHKFAIRDETGRPLLLCGMGVDVTEHKRVEQEVKRVNAELRSLLDNAPISIVLKDLEGRYLMVNQQWEQYFGRTANEIVGKTAEDVHGAETARALRSQELALLEAGGRVAGEVDFVVNGETRSILLNKFVVPNENGLPTMFCGMDVDFTAQKRLERELRDSEGRLRTILDALPNSVLLFDREGRIVYINPTARRFGEVEPDQDLSRMPRISFVAEEHREAAAAAFAGALSGERREVSLDLIGLKGTRRTLDIVYVPYARDESGVVSAVLSVGKDVTERRRLEARVRHLQKLESVGTLTGGVAHEFNNLLGVVLGNLDLLSLQLGGDDAKQRLLARIVSSATRGAELAHSMLAFGRRAMLSPVPTDAHALITQLVTGMTATLGPNIQSEIVADPDVARCNVDPTMLESAVTQLIDNACDAMGGQGRLRIEVRDCMIEPGDAILGLDGRAGHYVCISVADNGRGMSPEITARAIEPFFTTKEVGQGKGLGLSMVHGFVSQSGGHLVFAPNPGGGTIASMYLPTEDVTMATVARARPQRPASTHKVLVVEDEDDLRIVTAAGLRRHGFIVVEAANASAAIDALEQNRDIALMLSDIILGGGMDGFQLAKWVSTRRPEIRLMLTSGYAAADQLPADLRARDVPFLSKPYRLEGLVNQIGAAIGRPRTTLRVISNSLA